MCVCVYIYIYVCVCVCVCIYVYIYTDQRFSNWMESEDHDKKPECLSNFTDRSKTAGQCQSESNKE